MKTILKKIPVKSLTCPAEVRARYESVGATHLVVAYVDGATVVKLMLGDGTMVGVERADNGPVVELALACSDTADLDTTARRMIGQGWEVDLKGSRFGRTRLVKDRTAYVLSLSGC